MIIKQIILKFQSIGANDRCFTTKQPGSTIEETFPSNLLSEYYVKRAVILFILSSYVFVFSRTSMQIYSIEHGEIYAESYNINHILHSSSSDYCNSSPKNNDSLTLNWDYCHFHIIPLNSQALNHGDSINHYINLTISSSYPIQSSLRVFPLVPLFDFFTKLKILSVSHSSLFKSTVLLI
jgi:hypothetical protein